LIKSTPPDSLSSLLNLAMRVRLPDRKPIYPKQDDELKWRTDEKIHRFPCVTAHRDMVDRRVDVCRQEQYEHYGRNQPSQTPRLGYEETDSDRKFQDPRQRDSGASASVRRQVDVLFGIIKFNAD
jgi:hypothetical protein